MGGFGGPLGPGDFTVRDGLQGRATKNGESACEVAFIRREAGLEALSEIVLHQQLSIVLAQAHPLGLEMCKFLSDALEDLHPMGPEDVGFSLVFP